VADVGYRALVKRQWSLLWGPNSLVPNLKDLRDLYAHMKYFLFLGPKPKFDRYTYWEKLDYWGVFWGMAIIGFSGYAMWFAPAFARIIPGSWLNIALLIHGEEALLAVSFIFVVHFFNEHLRPHNFPMDVTIFTGTQTAEEFADRHPLEYARVSDNQELTALQAKEPSAATNLASRLLGSIAVLIGVVLIVLTIEAFIHE
jgi:cytochrome b subunit of formate dehydrogenase